MIAATKYSSCLFQPRNKISCMRCIQYIKHAFMKKCIASPRQHVKRVAMAAMFAEGACYQPLLLTSQDAKTCCVMQKCIHHNHNHLQRGITSSDPAQKNSLDAPQTQYTTRHKLSNTFTPPPPPLSNRASQASCGTPQAFSDPCHHESPKSLDISASSTAAHAYPTQSWAATASESQNPKRRAR